MPGRSLPDIAVCASDQMRGLGVSSADLGGVAGRWVALLEDSPSSDAPGEMLPLELSRSLTRTESSAASARTRTFCQQLSLRKNNGVA